MSFELTRRRLIQAAVLSGGATAIGLRPGAAGAAAPVAGFADRYTIAAFTNSSDYKVNIYQADDATSFRLVKAAAYTPPTGRIRDASILKHSDGSYYLTYTTDTWSVPSTKIGFARSTDRVAWTHLYDHTVPIANLSRAWAPEWFVDSD